MKAYAGIGSRKITDIEQARILRIASVLAESDYVVYSGNADGADISFQQGSGGKCVLFLPWKNFNKEHYNRLESIAWFEMGKSPAGRESIETFHPYPYALSHGGLCMMARNYHQINGHPEEGFERVDFVICCSDHIADGSVKGGTGFAVRIAQSLNIPIINVRLVGWEKRLQDATGVVFEDSSAW